MYLNAFSDQLSIASQDRVDTGLKNQPTDDQSSLNIEEWAKKIQQLEDDFAGLENNLKEDSIYYFQKAKEIIIELEKLISMTYRSDHRLSSVNDNLNNLMDKLLNLHKKLNVFIYNMIQKVVDQLEEAKKHLKKNERINNLQYINSLFGKISQELKFLEIASNIEYDSGNYYYILESSDNNIFSLSKGKIKLDDK